MKSNESTKITKASSLNDFSFESEHTVNSLIHPSMGSNLLCKVPQNELMSYILLDKHPLFHYADANNDIHVLCLGSGVFIRQMILSMLSVGQMASKNSKHSPKLHVHVASMDASNAQKALSNDLPELMNYVTVNNEKARVQEYAVLTFEDTKNLFYKTVYQRIAQKYGAFCHYTVISLGENANNAQLAENFAREIGAVSSRKAIVNYYLTQKSLEHLSLGANTVKKTPENVKIAPFGNLLTSYKKEVTDLGLKAFRVHYLYEKLYHQNVSKQDLMKNFAEDEYGQRSSLGAAVHINYKLASMDALYAPERSHKPIAYCHGKTIERYNACLADPVKYNRLLQLEHIRWMMFMITDGYTPMLEDDFKKYSFNMVDGRYNGAVKCSFDHVKKHPCLVPCNDLGIQLPADRSQWDEYDSEEKIAASGYDELDKLSLRVHLWAQNRVSTETFAHIHHVINDKLNSFVKFLNDTVSTSSFEENEIYKALADVKVSLAARLNQKSRQDVLKKLEKVKPLMVRLYENAIEKQVERYQKICEELTAKILTLSGLDFRYGQEQRQNVRDKLNEIDKFIQSIPNTEDCDSTLPSQLTQSYKILKTSVESIIIASVNQTTEEAGKIESLIDTLAFDPMITAYCKCCHSIMNNIWSSIDRTMDVYREFAKYRDYKDADSTLIEHLLWTKFDDNIMLIKPAAQTMAANIASAMIIEPQKLVYLGLEEQQSLTNFFKNHGGNSELSFRSCDFYDIQATTDILNELILSNPGMTYVVDITDASPLSAVAAYTLTKKYPSLALVNCNVSEFTICNIVNFPYASMYRIKNHIQATEIFELYGATRKNSTAKSDHGNYLPRVWNYMDQIWAFYKECRKKEIELPAKPNFYKPQGDDHEASDITKTVKVSAWHIFCQYNSRQPQESNEIHLTNLLQNYMFKESLHIINADIAQDSGLYDIFQKLKDKGHIKAHINKKNNQIIHPGLLWEEIGDQVVISANMRSWISQKFDSLIENLGSQKLEAEITDDHVYINSGTKTFFHIQGYKNGARNYTFSKEDFPKLYYEGVSFNNTHIWDLLTSLQSHGLLTALSSKKEGSAGQNEQSSKNSDISIYYTYASSAIKECFSVAGNILEARVWHSAMKTKYFDSIEANYSFNWANKMISNELDIILTHGLKTLICSCKATTKVNNAHLYELSALAHQFSVNSVPVFIYTADEIYDENSDVAKNQNSMAHFLNRAKEMGIAVIGPEILFSDDKDALGKALMEIAEGTYDAEKYIK